jgi:hypothetical protein
MTAIDLARTFNKKIETIAVYDPYLHYSVFNGIVNVPTEQAAKVFRFRGREAARSRNRHTRRDHCGDGWDHVVEFEELVPADGRAYPRCLAGAGACPPEDVGGTRGYAEFLQVIRNPRHPEHKATLEWVGGTFDPHTFEPRAVKFDDPRKR